MAAMRAWVDRLNREEQRIAAKPSIRPRFTGCGVDDRSRYDMDTVASATPIDDVEAAVNKVYDGSGFCRMLCG